MSVDEIKTLVMRFVDEPWNKGNVDIIDELCAPDYTLRYGTETNQEGRDQLKKAVIDTRTKNLDFKAEVFEVIVEGDRVAYEWAMSGTEDGKYQKYIGITILHLRDGKIISDRFLADKVKVEQPTA